ncbi:hypothetical protein [Roseomonas sp. CECT 9278]|uniref:hypothetical protein n=1 Tax=Roseomonas sp. CECT 9278 TaxID=2845823 RepID=UPI001E4BFB90|nr:hypothetical protein [Roseomonas sp. CECT 9278]
MPRRPKRVCGASRFGRQRAFAGVVIAALAPAGAALAQPAALCAASSDSPRTAAEVIAEVDRQRCPAGSRLRAIMTIAGQAIVLQHSGTCEREGFRTMSRTTADGSRGLGVTCTIAAR